MENEKLHFGDYPSEKFIHKLADELKADEDELLLLADKVPEAIRKRIRQRPELFRQIAKMDKQSLDRLEATLNSARRFSQVFLFLGEVNYGIESWMDVALSGCFKAC